MVKTYDGYGNELRIGDIVESAAHNRHLIVNMTRYLIVYKDKNGDMAYRPSRNYKKVKKSNES